MTDIIERLRGKPVRHDYLPEADRQEAADEIERLFIMTEMRGQEIERLNKDGAELAAIIRQQGFENLRLRAALEPFQRNVEAVSLSAALGHITREYLWEARRALEPKP